MTREEFEQAEKIILEQRNAIDLLRELINFKNDSKDEKYLALIYFPPNVTFHKKLLLQSHEWKDVFDLIKNMRTNAITDLGIEVTPYE